MAVSEPELYSTIAEAANAAAPAGWQKLWVRADLGKDTGETVYDYLDAEGNTRWFEPETRLQYEIYRAFQQLRQLAQLSGQPEWSGAVFTLEPGGKFSIDLSYSDTAAAPAD